MFPHRNPPPSPQLLCAILSNLPGAVFVGEDRVDGSVEYTYISGGIFAMSGWTPGEWMELFNRGEGIHPEDRAKFGRAREERRLTGNFSEFFRMMRKDGSYGWVLARTRVSARQASGLAIISGLLLDASREVDIRQALERSEAELTEMVERLKTVIDNLPGVVYRSRVTSMGRELIYLSDAFEQQYGLPADRFMAMSQAERNETVHPDDRAAFRRRWDELNTTGKVLATARYFHPDGRLRWFEYHERVLRRQGDALLVEGLVLDITGAMTAKESLIQVEKTLQFSAQSHWHEGDEDFLPSLVRHLGESLQVDYVIVDRLCDDPGMAETVALYAKGNVVPNIRYPLENTPCADILAQGLCCFPAEVQRLFPLDRLLVEMGVESYIGIPLWDSRGKVLGLIAVMDSHHLNDRRDLANRLLQIVATRAGATLESTLIRREREQQEEQLRIAATAFEAQEGMMITDDNAIILRVNHAFSVITGYSPEEVIGQTPKMLQSGRHDSMFYAAIRDQVDHQGFWTGEIWDKRKNGEIYPQLLSISKVNNPHGETSHYVGMFSDISARKEAETSIEQLAFYDPLTELPNRRLLLDRLKHILMASARRQSGTALLFLDLDNFKVLNDTYGHDIGDMLLVSVANRLRTCLRESDTVARIGGDEFVVILEALSHDPQAAAAQAKAVSANILSVFGPPFDLNGFVHYGTLSIGVTLFFDDALSTGELLKQADIAMYQAKASGRNTACFFDVKMQTDIAARTALESMLRLGMKQGQLALHYQAQVNGDNRVIGAEALLRWKHPEKGMISPVDFIPLAEETGLIVPIGQWVLETACSVIQKWSGDPVTSDLILAVNVSARQFRQPDFVDQVRLALFKSEAPASRLKLELTESLVLVDVEDAIKKMQEIKMLGVGFAMDDFGTGFSSLSYLTKLPLDQVKIDQSFVRNLPGIKNDAVVVQAIIALAVGLGMSVIAEGVETDEQRRFLDGYGCSTFQGYLFSRPVALEQFEILCRHKTHIGFVALDAQA